jgi:hypothetical protein
MADKALVEATDPGRDRSNDGGVRATARRTLERPGHVDGRLETGSRCLFEQAAHDVGDSRRHVRSGLREVRRLGRENGMKGFESAAPGERPAAAQHLEQHHTQRKEVGSCIDIVAPDLLGCHVAGGADDHAGERLGRRLRRRRVRHLQLREAEVENLDPAVGGQEKIVGFQIAMNDPAGVRGAVPRATCTAMATA